MLLYECIDLIVLHNEVVKIDILLLPFSILGIQSIFLSASITHWWFISCLIILYLIFPILSFFSAKLHNKLFIIISLSIISFYIYYVA